MDLKAITRPHEGCTKIDARKLYHILGHTKGKFNRWSTTNIEENDFFFENVDWIKIKIVLTDDNILKNKDIEVPKIENNTPQRDINDDEKLSRIKKDFLLSFDMAYHLSLQSDTETGHEIRQALIKNKKIEIENKRKIAELSIINQADKNEIKDLKKQRFKINKRIAYLVQKTENQDNELHYINTGEMPKTEIAPQSTQTALLF